MNYKLWHIFFITLFISLSSCSIFKTDPYQCETCHGNGYIHQSCSACQPIGSIHCNHCHLGKETCWRCSGTGYDKICVQCSSVIYVSTEPTCALTATALVGLTLWQSQNNKLVF